MKKIMAILFVLALTAGVPYFASAVLIDFDSQGLLNGQSINNTYVAGQYFSTPYGDILVMRYNDRGVGYASSPYSILHDGTQADGLGLIQVDFDAPVEYVEITGGDWGVDDDSFYLEVYDSDDNFIARAETGNFGGNPTPGGSDPVPYVDIATLSISGYTNIAYAIFQGTSGPHPGGVSFDNLIFEYYDDSTGPDPGGPAVPEPGSIFLIGTGLLGLLGYSRKKLFKK